MYTKHKTRGTQYSESPCNLLLGTREPSRSVGAVVPKYQWKTPLCLFQTSILLLNFPVLHLSTAETKLPSVYVTSVNCLVQSLGNKLPSPPFFKNTSNNHQQQRANTIISLCVWAFFCCCCLSPFGAVFPIITIQHMAYVLRLPKALHCSCWALTVEGAGAASVKSNVHSNRGLRWVSWC